ncbi:hypothetical protein [Microbispora amethystogenes]|uniref:Secreted protein n=1 Tax=Microbispora amethystogenes TaxID=1427754 RepID=A0ABQ4FIW9_9ACTN|nr:hypothetical protein [Microbispora amethystogenes]GIH34766.1 hypothetical protein Mam01_49300 [Microbispora amethystogenes]
MTNPWDAVRSGIDAGDASAVATAVLDLDDDARREVARELPGYLPAAREAAAREERRREQARQARWEELCERAARTGRSVHEFAEAYTVDGPSVRNRWIEPVRVAGAAVLPGAAAVATWLNRRDFDRGWEPADTDDVPLIAAVVAARLPEWRRDLAVRLARRLRGARPRPDRRVRLALRLLRESGAEPPEHDPLTLAWVAATLSDDLPADPLLDAMLPRLFEAEGVGRLLRTHRNWPAVLTALAKDGRVGRAALLDGCRSRFLRGGQAADQRFFVFLHDQLAPSPEEIAPYARDYLALLPAAAANVADLALRQVRRLGPIPAEQAGEAVEALLFRAEGRLVRAGLTWLDRLLKDPAEDADAYAPALTAALGSESGDARERAVKLAVKHADRFTPLGADMIRDAVAALPAHEGSRLAAVFGGEVAAAPEPEPEPARFVPVPLPAVPEPTPMPPAPETPEELARITLTEYDWRAHERWLDGFVRLAARHRTGGGRDRLVGALAPLTRHWSRSHPWTPWWDTADWAAAMAKELAEPGAWRQAHPQGTETVTERVPDMRHGAGARVWTLMRYAEVYQAQLEDRLPAYLLGTPTRANGILDPDALVERIEGYERDGVQALPLDLRQALLRLGRTVPGEVATRAAALTSPAGRTVARWLTDRPAEPEVILRWDTHQGDVRVFSEFVCGPEHREVLGDLLTPRFHDEACERLLAVLAGHRELAAARSAWTLRSFWPLNKPTPADLELLVTADGPAGQGVALIMAHYLHAGPVGGAVGPLLRLAATGGLPGEELGRQLAVLLERRPDGLAGVMEALRTAAERGAHREVWQIMRGLLPGRLPRPGERATPAHTRLMRFAADVGEWADARGDLPVVAELAGRRRASELVRQARRLHGQLSGGAFTT